jgi:hypothetical protein
MITDSRIDNVIIEKWKNKLVHSYNGMQPGDKRE